MDITKTIERYGIPPKWQIYFSLLFFVILSLLFIPDSWSKGALTQIASVATLVGMFGGFFHNKHSLTPWIFLFIGSTLFGTSYSLTFLNLSGTSINAINISMIVEIGMILILIFAYNIALIYEKKLNLPGVSIDLVLITISLLFFFLFIHPTLLNTFLYETSVIQKLYFSQIVLSVLVLFMSILINILYQGKRSQLLLLIPMSIALLAQFLVQMDDVLFPLEKIQYFSPLSSVIFVFTGFLVGIFCFIETFSEYTIAENHLEIQKSFTKFYNRLMWIAITLASIVIPMALIIRILYEFSDIPLLVIAISSLFIGTIVAGRFISIIKQSQAQQKKLLTITQTDKLTGLLNYAGFYDCLLNRDLKTILIVFLNVDDFKSTNHYYGRKFGDQILIRLAQKLNSIPNAIVSSRMGSDNFIIAYETDESNVEEITSNLINQLGAWDTVMKKKTPVLLTFGSCYTSDAKKLETKIRYAEYALKKAREMHVNHYLFKASDDKQELPRHELQQILQQAIDNNHLPVHFQPIYNLNDGSLKALELLIRIESKKHGMLLPKQFLEQAHSYGFLTALTKVCLNMVAQYSQQLPNVTININLPPYILLCSETLTELIDHIKELRLNPKQLCFEITEDENISSDKLISQVKYLTDNHFTIAMDDFGTGYSSLERLSLLPFDTIKIDRSLLLAASNGNKTILESSIGLIKRLGESVVVEGVESLEQLSLIKKLGADSVQGFLLSKPIPILKIHNLPKNISEVVSEY